MESLLVGLALTLMTAPPGNEATVLTHVYELERQKIYVVYPSAGCATRTPDVFVYYHGLGGYYSSRGKENALTHTGLRDALAQAERGVIAILPEARRGDADRRSAHQRVLSKPGGFQRLVDSSLAEVARLTNSKKVLTPRGIAIAAHSAGGAMIGRSVETIGGAYGARVTDVTLMDAGYRFKSSWRKLRDWLTTDPSGKNLRIFYGGGQSAAYAVAYFSRSNRPARFRRGLAGYRGLAPWLARREVTLTSEQIDQALSLGGLELKLLELNRGEKTPGVAHIAVGSIRGRGHYALRNATMPGALGSIGAGEPGWLLRD